MYNRLKSGPLSNEEMRFELHPNKVNRIEYVGLATAGTATSSAIWTILKVTYDGNGLAEREQVFTNVAWDSRSDL